MKKLTILSVLILTFAARLFSQVAVMPSEGQGTRDNPFQIETLENLYWIATEINALNKHYIQTANIDAEETAHWFQGAGWLPIGTQATPFTGAYDAREFIIENLFINRSQADYVGLFGYIDALNIQEKFILKNIKLHTVNITGREGVGSLAGAIINGQNTRIINCYAYEGTVNGVNKTGGLVGINNGRQQGQNTQNQSVIENSFTNVTVNYIGTSNNNGYFGGIAGICDRGTLNNCFSLGDVNAINGSFKANNVGGLTGFLAQGEINNSFSLSLINGDNQNVGALAGKGTGLGNMGVTNSFYNADTWSGNTLGTAASLSQFTNEQIFINAGWDFNNVWGMHPEINNGYPFFLSNPPLGSISIVYNGTDDNWNSPANWYPSGIPHSNSNVLIPEGVNLNIEGAAEINNLKIAPDASLTINEQATLDVNGNICIFADENSTGSFIDDGTLNVKGNVKFQKFLKSTNPFGWTVASPVKNAGKDVFDASMGVFYFDPIAADWAVYNNGDMEIMKGYWTKFNNDQTIEFISLELNSGKKVYDNFYRTGFNSGNMGWNFIGNPYPSAIDWEKIVKLDDNGGSYNNFLTTTKLNSAIYISNNNGGYESFVAGVGTNGFNGIISPATAFWIQVNKDHINQNGPIQDAKLTLNNSVRIHENRPANNKTANVNDIIRLRINNDRGYDEAVVRFIEGATPDFDAQFDAVKMFSQNNAQAQLYTLSTDNTKLSINALSNNITEALTIPIGYTDYTQTKLSFSLHSIDVDGNFDIFLEDKSNGVLTDLKKENTYTFFDNNENEEDRFLLHLIPKAANISMGTNNNAEMFVYNNKLYINGFDEEAQLKVYNVMGQELLNQTLSPQTHIIDLNFSSGIYTVSLQQSNNINSKQVYIQ